MLRDGLEARIDAVRRFNRFFTGRIGVLPEGNSVLDAARHIYERQRFELVEEEEHHSFGRDLVGQNWELAL